MNTINAVTAKKVFRAEVRNGNYMIGMHAAFVKINTNWGVKFFWDRDIAEGSMRLQKQAFDKGFAPQVGSGLLEIRGVKILFHHGLVKTRWGFITEVVPEVIGETISRIVSAGRRDAESDRWWKIVYEFEKEFAAAGFNSDDLHLGNVGIAKDGSLKVIDFSYDIVHDMPLSHPAKYV